MKLGKGLLLAVCVMGVCLLQVSLAGCGSGTSEPSPYAGHYHGTFAGNDYGTWTADVDEDGNVTLQVVANFGGTFGGDGTVSRTGVATLSAQGGGGGGGFTMTWNGNFVIGATVISGSGTWVATNGFTGTWVGDNS